MQTLPSVYIPDYFAAMLKTNIYADLANYYEFKSVVLSNKSLLAVFTHSFRDVDEMARPEYVYKVLGWSGIRTRLINIFLSYQKEGIFFSTPKQDFMLELSSIEGRLAGFTVEGHSRIFLLLFYLKSVELRHGYKSSFYDFLEGQKALDILRAMKSKTIYLDWVLVLLYHFSLFFNIEDLKKYLSNGTTYDELYLRLSTTEKRLLLENALSYSYSIHDDLFHNDTLFQ